MKDIRLFSYKITNDTGFAPNPFHGMLTLATCMPGIRRTKNIGDWVAGFTSKKLNEDNVKKERLVYLMKVEEKIPYEKYFTDKRFVEKIPDYTKGIAELKVGDNIYQPTPKGEFKQLRSRHSKKDGQECPEIMKCQAKGLYTPNCSKKDSQECPKTKKHDLNGLYVLISKCFYYFGSSPIEIPKAIKPKIPPYQTNSGWETNNPIAEKFIFFVEKEAKKKSIIQPGIYSFPHNWSDENVITQKSCGKCR